MNNYRLSNNQIKGRVNVNQFLYDLRGTIRFYIEIKHMPLIKLFRTVTNFNKNLVSRRMSPYFHNREILELIIFEKIHLHILIKKT